MPTNDVTAEAVVYPVPTNLRKSLGFGVRAYKVRLFVEIRSLCQRACLFSTLLDPSSAPSCTITPLNSSPLLRSLTACLPAYLLGRLTYDLPAFTRPRPLTFIHSVPICL